MQQKPGSRTRVGPRNLCGPESRSPWEGAILMEEGRPIVKLMSTLRWAVKKTAEPRSRCRLGFGLGWTKLACIRRGAQWRHLANTIEPSMCGGDAAYCQITLTAYYLWVEWRKHKKKCKREKKTNLWWQVRPLRWRWRYQTDLVDLCSPSLSNIYTSTVYSLRNLTCLAPGSCCWL